jgi:hypothetical protein
MEDKPTLRTQVVKAEERGDACYANLRGWYWHELDEDSGIDTTSIRGPFVNSKNAKAAMLAGTGRLVSRHRRTKEIEHTPEVWVITYNFSTIQGSVSHLSGLGYWPSREACEAYMATHHYSSHHRAEQITPHKES